MPIQKLKDMLVALFHFFPQIDNAILHQVFHYYNSFDNPGYSLNTYFHPVTTKNAASRFSDGYFEKPNTENDIFLQSSIPWDSPLYYTKGTPLAYTTPFALKLKRIDDDHTQLTIEALSPSVYNGVGSWDMILCDCSIFSLRTKAVQATTIEEHTLLLFIAEQLGDNSVEPLKMPEPLQNLIAHNSVLPHTG